MTPTDLSNPRAKHRSIRPTVQTKRKPLSDEQLVTILPQVFLVAV
jgi:hypothetical protein